MSKSVLAGLELATGSIVALIVLWFRPLGTTADRDLATAILAVVSLCVGASVASLVLEHRLPQLRGNRNGQPIPTNRGRMRLGFGLGVAALVAVEIATDFHGPAFFSYTFGFAVTSTFWLLSEAFGSLNT